MLKMNAFMAGSTDSINKKIKKIIDKLKLVPLENEGGFYHEIYRSDGFIEKACLPEKYSSKRCFYTSIYYLITEENYSRLHKVNSDEIFNFYMGDPVEMINLFLDGSFKKIILGRNIFKGEVFQYMVPAGTWQGAKLKKHGKKDGGFALLGTVVAPGFEFEDFVLGTEYKEEILEKYGNIKSGFIDYF